MKVIIEILTDPSFIGAIFTSLFFIFLGFILRYKKIIGNDCKNFLNFIVLKISLPAMAFSAFMTDFQKEEIFGNIMVFVVSLGLYVIFLILGRLVLLKVNKEKRGVMTIMMVVGQLTFFAVPLLKTIYSNNYNDVMIPANMMTLAFRIILYIYCYFTISKLKFSKKEIGSSLKNIFLNPVMIAMFLGLFIWLSQNIMPHISIDNGSYSIFRLDKTLPSIYMVISTAEKLTTPLAMIIIGIILGEAKISEALKDKMAWLISIFKTIVVPLSTLGIIAFLKFTGLIDFNEYAIAVIVLGFGAPLSAVVSTYCSKYNNEAELSSRVCFISTILCIITFPLLFVMIRLF